MVKIGTDVSKWTQVVNDGEKDVKGIESFKNIRLSATDLKPFTDVSEIIEQFNNSLKKLKAYSETESSKMIQVSKNKQQDDFKYASGKGFGGKIITGYGASGPNYKELS